MLPNRRIDCDPATTAARGVTEGSDSLIPQAFCRRADMSVDDALKTMNRFALAVCTIILACQLVSDSFAHADEVSDACDYVSHAK